MSGVPKAWSACLPLGCALTMACGAPAELDVARVEQGVVYDTDDRQELYLAPDALRTFGERSVVALVEGVSVGGSEVDPKRVFLAPTWGERRDLCAEVRFAGQPAAAVCSGVLVDTDLVLTAGHCARNLACDTLNLVFGYHYREPGAVPVLDDDDVYHCAAVPSFQIANAADNLDYGFVRLDRPVSADKQPAALEASRKSVDTSTRLQALSFGGGIPLKAQTDVEVHDARPGALDYFVTALDAFEGASGGPLISADGSVVGILAHGNTDYVQNQAGCTEIAVLPEAAADERATYAFRAIEGLCRDSPESTRLCEGAEAAAGEGGCALAARARGTRLEWGPALLFVVLASRRARRALRGERP